MKHLLQRRLLNTGAAGRAIARAGGWTLPSACLWLLLSAAQLCGQDIYFSTNQYTAFENNGPIIITVQRNETDFDMTVDLQFIDGTATNGIDYLGTNGTLTLYFDEGEASVFIDILDNYNPDGDRTFTLSLLNPSYGTAGPDATVTIVDDDTNIVMRSAGALQFTSGATPFNHYITSEGDYYVRITVTRAQAATGRIMVDYTISDDTAILGTDYDYPYNYDIANNIGTLVFDDFEMSQSFYVPLIDNTDTNSPNVQFLISLSNPRLAPEWPERNLVPTLGSPPNTIVEMIDNEQGFNFAAYYRASGAGQDPPIKVAVILPSRHKDGCTVDYRTLVTDKEGADSFPLTAGSDYGLVDVDFPLTRGTLTFGSNDYVKTFDLPTLGINGLEFNKDLRLQLSNPKGKFLERGTNEVDAKLGLNTNANVTMIFGFGYTIYSTNGVYAYTTAGPQPAGAVDLTWDIDRVSWTTPPYNPTPGANNTVYAVLVQPDQKTLVAGDFNAVNTDPWNHIARLDSNGASDFSFAVGTGADDFVDALAIYKSGVNSNKIIIGGGFTSFNGATRYGVARLNGNGTLDTTFDPGTGVDVDEWGQIRPVRAVAVQPDGKVLIGGDFLTVNGFTRHRIARLNQNGSVDTSFLDGTQLDLGANGTVWAIALLTNGSIVIAGDFWNVNGAYRSGIAVLNSDGTLDTTFDPGSGTDGTVYGLAIQADQKILVAGAFSQINLFSRNCIARFNTNGTLDTTFDPGTGTDNTIFGISLQPDQKILAVGAFNLYNDTRRIGVTRIHTNGVVDTSFMDTAYNQYAGLFDRTNFLVAVDLEANGSVLIGGSFQRVGGGGNRVDIHPRYNVARLIGGSTWAPGYVEFSQTEYRADEYGGTLYATLMRRDGNLGGMDIRGRTVNGLAQAGVDYQPTANVAHWINHPQYPYNTWYEAYGQVNSIVFNPYIAVPIINDTNIEGNETFNLELVPPFQTLPLGGDLIPTGVGLGRRHAVATIVDDDFKRGEFSFVSPTYAVNENDLQGAVVTVIRTGGTVGAASVDYYTGPYGSPSASAGLDYQSKSGTLNFASGQSSQTIRITIYNDTTVEPDEYFQIRLSNPTAGAAIGAVSNTVVTIIDDDYKPGRLSFTSPTYTESETTPYATITAQRTGGNLGQVSVQYATVLDSAVPGINYSNVSGQLVWNDGDSSNKTFRVPLINNGLVEGPRMVALTLRNFLPSDCSGGTTNAKLTILDDDFYGTLQFSASDYFADENGAPAIITVVRTGGIAGTIHVNYAITNLGVGQGFATPGLDYTNVFGTLEFPPGQLSASFQVPVINDSLAEGLEMAQLLLLNPADGASLGPRTTANFNIIDDESENIPAGTLDSTFRIGVGANGNVNAIALQTNKTLVIGGDFTLVDNSPRNHLARLLEDGSVDPVFGSLGGVNGSIYTIALQDDQKAIIGGTFTTVNGTNRNHIARINTDGSIDAFFNPGSGADNPVNAIALQRIGQVQKVLLGGGFASVNGASRNSIARLNDNGTLDSSFAIGTGANGPVYALAVQADGKVLVGGDFSQFNGTTNCSIVRLNTNGTLDATFDPGTGPNNSIRAIAVQSDGAIVLGGFFTSFNGSNACRLVRLDIFGHLDTNFLAAIGTAANGPVLSISLQVDGKLVVAGDFTSFNGTTRSRLTRLNPDGTVDPTINFGSGANDLISATVVQTDRKIVIGGAFTSYDGQPMNYIARLHGGSLAGSGSLQFSAAAYQVLESSNQVFIDVWRKGGTFGAVTVHFATAGGTATPNLDYVATNGDLVFAEGETRQTLAIHILDDTLVEDDETVNLVLSNPSNGATNGAQPTATLTILNDDSQISFAFPTYSITENFPTANASISVTRTGALSTAVSVDYWTIPGTGQPGVDYTSVSNTLTFWPGETNKFFNVPIIVNPVISENPTVLLRLGRLQGHGQIAAPSNAVLTILENETSPGLITFFTSAYSIVESNGTLIVPVSRTNGHTGPVSVHYATIDVTATNGLDYFGSSGTLSFVDGETLKTISIPIVSDTLVEGNETFDIILSNATGGLVLGNITRLTVTIVDDDIGPGSLDASFDPGSGANNFVRSMALQPDGRIVIGGAFTRVAGSNFNYIARLRTNGVLDTTFNPGSAGNGMVNSVMVDVNSNIVVGGAFTTFNGSNRAHVVRLKTTGLHDPNLLYNPNLNAIVYDAIGLPDGKLLAGGAFSAPPKSGIARFFVNGQPDTGFDPGFAVTNGVVFSLLMDGSQTLAGGTFTRVDVLDRSRVVRLNSDGRVDLTFVPPVIGGSAYALALQADRKVLVGGDFTNVLGQARTRLIRLNLDGSLDTNYAAISISAGVIYGLALQSDGKALAVGSFNTVNGFQRNRIVRFHADGTLDQSFDPGLGANNTIYDIVVQPDRHILIAGAFTAVNGFPRNGIARLTGDPAIELALTPSWDPITGWLTFVWPTQTGRNYTIYVSTDLITWKSLATYTALADTMSYTDSDTQSVNCRFYRVEMEGP